MAFAFNFSGDDIDDEEPQDGHTMPAASKPNIETNSPPMQSDKLPPPEVPVRKHNLREMLRTLPSQISYSTTLLVSPQQERRALIPRRALFDVRMQIMAESPGSPPSSTEPTNHDRDASQPPMLSPPTSGKKKKKRPRDLNSDPISQSSDDTADPASLLLTDSDLASSIYEGGFKSWEGSTDLARLVLERGPRRDIDELSRVDHVIELGCGTALPSLVLFQYALRHGLAVPFTLADFNDEVLRLVTLPNLVCVWAAECAPEVLGERVPQEGGDGTVIDGDGEVEVTEKLIERFLQDLEGRGMSLTLLSGPWSPGLTRHLVTPLAAEMGILVLAAETIYSPVTMVTFADVLVELLRKVRHGKAFVAAKRVYFGVGGSVDAFKAAMSERAALCGEVQNSGIEGCDRSTEATQTGTGGGVGRCLLEVQMF